MITTSKAISLGFLSIGVFVLMQIIMPVISFQVWEISQKYNDQLLISPANPNQKQILGVSIENKDNFSTIVSNIKRETIPNYSKFNLSIPSLNLKDLNVFVDSNDLSIGAAHLPGSALPGEKGNVFISGHSSLMRFFIGKTAVFSRLPDIKKGDQIEIEANGAKFLYKIIQLKTVDPSDISVIEPPDQSGRYITLMTCVPPGLSLKRLIVLGKII